MSFLKSMLIVTFFSEKALANVDRKRNRRAVLKENVQTLKCLSAERLIFSPFHFSWKNICNQYYCLLGVPSQFPFFLSSASKRLKCFIHLWVFIWQLKTPLVWSIMVTWNQGNIAFKNGYNGKPSTFHQYQHTQLILGLTLACPSLYLWSRFLLSLFVQQLQAFHVLNGTGSSEGMMECWNKLKEDSGGAQGPVLEMPS